MLNIQNTIWHWQVSTETDPEHQLTHFFSFVPRFLLSLAFPFVWIIPIQKGLQHTAGLQAKRKHRKRVHNVKLEGAELQGAAGELEPHSMWYETETWPRDTEEHKITSYQLKGLISPQRDCVSPRLCAKPLRDACKHLLHRITFRFLISPLFKPLSFIPYRSSLHSETQVCPFAPTFGCLALFAAAQWTDL